MPWCWMSCCPTSTGWKCSAGCGAELPYVCVLFLTARDAVDDRVAGLTAGGDDYVTKPFSLEEVLARLRGLLRRAGIARPGGGTELVVSDLTMDEDAREVRRAGQLIELTATEFELLRLLMRNPHRVLCKAQILDRVWHYDYGGQAHVVELYISYLRRKVNAGREPLIHTVRARLRAEAAARGYLLTTVPARLPRPGPGRSRARPGTAARPAQVNLERVQQPGQHGEVTQAADQVNDPLLAQLGDGPGERAVGDEVVTQDLGAELVDDLLVRPAQPGSRRSASAARPSLGTPRSAALPTCAFQEYCASKRRAAMSRLSSRSRGSSADSNRQYAPSASTFSHSSGLRSQTRNGPRVPPRRLLIRSLISCWRGDREVRAGSRMVKGSVLNVSVARSLLTLPTSARRCLRL